MQQYWAFPHGPPIMSHTPRNLPIAMAKATASKLTEHRAPHPRVSAVLSGSYRRDTASLKRAHESLESLGVEILSPQNVDVQREDDGFVFMRGELGQAPSALESRHLDAIERAHFMWLHAPDGYVGTSAALEIGFARAAGVPVYSDATPSDPVLRRFVSVVPEPGLAVRKVADAATAPTGLRAFQHYYRRVAVERGYEREVARDCLLLMLEEVGELARAVRRQASLVRHHSDDGSGIEHELADVFLYVVHLANIIDCDLAKAVQSKERINHARFLRTRLGSE